MKNFSRKGERGMSKANADDSIRDAVENSIDLAKNTHQGTWEHLVRRQPLRVRTWEGQMHHNSKDKTEPSE